MIAQKQILADRDMQRLIHFRAVRIVINTG